MQKITIKKQLKKYPDYKESGIDWIGEIPKGWEIKKIKFIGKTIAGGTPVTTEPSYWNGGNIPWLPSGTVQNNIITTEHIEKYITKKGLIESAAKVIKPNSVLVALTGATCANIGYLTFEATANQSVIAVHNNENINSKFLFYSSLSNREQFLFYKTGGAQSGINDNNVKNVLLSIPPKEDQEKIANYLDEKTELINQIIDKKQRLIELLKEKKSALINKVVIKGLDDSVEMVDSGVDWIGEVPKGWEIEKIKYLSPQRNKKIDKFSNEIKYIGLENIESGSGKILNLNSEQEVESIVNEFKQGDVLFGKLRPYLAKVLSADFSGVCTGELLVLMPKHKKLISQFLFYRMISSSFIKLVDNSTYGTKMPRASWDFIGEVFLAVPSLLEQEKIANTLDEESKKITYLIDEIKKSINLLVEYKSSLIFNTVTGKILI